ncbi:hypothetical protein [Pontibacter sp. G13]|uniref:hypothetical protein n=1 Tax=Pontibacter sp. G13 TaxID=3074898 RepID=UPI00288BE7B8|nr:hypothetical protein [Pontibacter sp. G13]WNJ18516.1 hypothetical protein RJD25_26980 [Pontibacter sp. G13]
MQNHLSKQSLLSFFLLVSSLIGCHAPSGYRERIAPPLETIPLPEAAPSTAQSVATSSTVDTALLQSLGIWAPQIPITSWQGHLIFDDVYDTTLNAQIEPVLQRLDPTILFEEGSGIIAYHPVRDSMQSLSLRINWDICSTFDMRWLIALSDTSMWLVQEGTLVEGCAASQMLNLQWSNGQTYAFERSICEPMIDPAGGPDSTFCEYQYGEVKLVAGGQYDTLSFRVDTTIIAE